MNNKLKKVFLTLAMISLAIVLTVIPSIVTLNGAHDGLWTSYMDSDKKLIEKDFYKSNRFEFGVLRPVSFWLGQTVRNIDESVEQYIGWNTYSESVTYTDENGIEQEKYETRKPTKEEAIKAVEKTQNSAKERLKEQYSSIKFMAVNPKDNTYYTNTSYKTGEEFNKNVKGYVNVELHKNNTRPVYIKNINGKSIKNYQESQYKLLDAINNNDVKIYISFPKTTIGYDTLSGIKNSYEKAIAIYEIFLVAGIVNLLVFIVATIMYKRTKGEVLGSDSTILKLLRKIPLEIWALALLFPAIWAFTFGISYYQYGYDYYYNGSIYSNAAESLLAKGIGCGLIFLLLFALYSLIKVFASYDRKIDILKNTVVFKAYKLIVLRAYKFVTNSIKRTLGLTKKMPFTKTILLVGLGCTVLSVLMNFMFLGFVPIIIFIVYIFRKLYYLSEIMEGTKKIKDGELDYKIDIIGNDNFTELAEDINNIGEGLENSIDNQLRSERMKSELITNVSHDLKTPLTSIINYVELIKKEENIQPEHIKDYVNVLDSKSKRLKALIEDLFEASKASSGNIELNMEKIDIKQLLRQSIGEMDQKLSESNLDIRLTIPEESTYIRADGRRLYRVLENLISNISKYSLENTRVYIDLSKIDNKVVLTMKNISSYELNFNPEEITERFKRADQSRNTEGSGLGLSIAKDLVNLQGGIFNIEIDGDLFKSVIEFKEVK